MTAKLPFFALFEDAGAPPGAPAAWVFEQPLTRREILDDGHSAAPGEALRAALAEAAAAGVWAVWALDYELGLALEPALQAARRPGRLARLWTFAACRSLSAADLDDWWAAQGALGPAGIGGLAPECDFADYQAALRTIDAAIQAGECYQINFTFGLAFQSFGRPLDLYRRLRARQPVRYGGLLIDADGSACLSLSPELFLARQGRQLRVRPMKGTAARADTPAADADAAAALLASPKNRAENLMIVDLLRNDLGRLARPGSVTVRQLFALESYPTVHQMVSEIDAEVADAFVDDDFAVLRALFPCGSITGAPKVRAMQIIAAQEAAPRGLYTGAFGWRAPEGELRLNVAIRTLEIAADGRGRLGIGSGIVADSDIEAEWQECCLKGHFLAELDPGLALIETLRLEVRAGRAHFPRAAGHVQRMLASAAWFAFPVTAAALEAALAAAASGRADGVYRLRLTLDKAGRLASQVHALQPEVPGPRWIVLAEERIAADDPLRRHKTTARAPYERALAAVQDRPEIFDVIFCNTRGELAEGARSTLFVRLAGQWLTPPLAAGALPGVLRAERLALGWAREACLWPADLLRAEAIECGNALRGGVPVRVWPADKFPQPAVEAPSP